MMINRVHTRMGKWTPTHTHTHSIVNPEDIYSYLLFSSVPHGGYFSIFISFNDPSSVAYFI